SLVYPCMLRSPPTATPFPTRRSSDLLDHADLRQLNVVGVHHSQLRTVDLERLPAAALFLKPGAPHPAASEPSGTGVEEPFPRDRKSTRLNSRHAKTSYAVFCVKQKPARRLPPSPRTP